MNKKLFLTSAIAMGFVAPAMAEMTPSSTFPDASQGEYMQENTRYIGAATSTNMDGVYEDGATVDANALYDNLPYSVEAGFYLTGVDNSNDAITAACTAGSYCPGVTSTTYDYETEAFGETGIQSCPTIDNTAFTSASGSSALTNCYDEDSAMSSALLNPFTNTAHVDTSVSGNGYINGVKYASETTAARRYATSATTAGEWAALDPSDLEIEDLACVNGWHFKPGLNVEDTIGNEAGINSAYISSTGTFSETDANFQPGNKGQAYYGISDNMSWAVEYGSNKGMLIGQGRCSTQQGFTDGTTNSYNYTDPTIKGTLTDETGQDGAKYCYCNVTGYKDADGNLQGLSSSWVFRNGYDDASDCAYYCARNCAAPMRFTGSNDLAFRAALLGSVGASPAMCAANTITINWYNADEEDITANNAGVATYGEDVRTPVKAQTFKGKTFKGWRFSNPEKTTTE